MPLRSVNELTEAEKEQAIINSLVRWAEKQEAVRAMLLYGSRANPGAAVDVFSDYDVLLAVADVHRFHEDDRWLDDLGRVLVVFRNPIALEYGFESFGFVTHYEDGTKIDYGFYTVAFLTWAAKQPALPDDLDNGYMVLLDKDDLTGGLQPPTYAAYLPAPPTEREYRAVIDEFFNDSAYVAKHLRRGNLIPVKLSLDHIMKFQCLRRMLEWRMEIEHHWSVKPGAYGRSLQQRCKPELWSALESTYVGAGAEENWAALFNTIDLFRTVSTEVAEHLGFTYPHHLDQRMLTYLHKVKDLDRQAESFA